MNTLNHPDKENRPSPTPQEWEALFEELCRAHHLTWRQKGLLKTISQSLDVEPAARLFVEPDWFVAASKTQELQNRKGQLVELCKILFYRERNNTEEKVESPKQTMHTERLAGV